MADTRDKPRRQTTVDGPPASAVANLAGLRRSYARAAGELPIGFGFQPERAQEFANPHASWRSASKVSGGVSGHSGVLVGLAVWTLT
jgi:hypothetical protein